MTSSAVAETEPVTSRQEYFARVAIEQLVESPLNPRKSFILARLEELAASIRAKGIVEPLVVRPTDVDEQFEIICGARRYRAAKSAGLFHLPCIVRAYTDAQALEIMAIENGQRDDVPPLEEAAGYKQLLLIDQTYTAAMIAQRIGHTERYVWDRMKLLDLIAELQVQLSLGRIGVEHAEILAKLKPAEQRRAANPSAGALFEQDYALKFDDVDQPVQYKARSVRQLKEWIARHVRFDVAHFAAAAPLEFGQTAQKVVAAEAQEGRGKKVVPITFETMCPGGAKDDTERTYGATAWKKAVGKDGQPTCDHAVLGLVVAGEHYGESIHVCIARDRCTTHWKEQVAAKAKAEKLRASGKGKQAAKVEKKSQQRTEDKWERERRERERREEAWKAIETLVVAEAVRQVKDTTVLTAKHAAALEKCHGEIGFEAIKKHLGAKWYQSPAAALLVSVVSDFGFQSWNNSDEGIDQFERTVAVPFGLDVKKLRAVAEQHQREAAALKLEGELQGGRVVQDMRGVAKPKKAAKRR